MKNILVADDHPLFLAGLTTLLAELIPDINIYQTSDLEGVKKYLLNETIELLLIDRIMPGMDGMKHIPELHHQYPDLTICIISASDSSANIREALNSGASGFIPKSYAPCDTVDAVKQLLKFRIFIPAQVWQTQAISNDENVVLSARQIEVLSGIVEGHSNKVIASELSIEEGTVKQHIHNIFKLLMVNSRTQAVLRCRDLGLIS